MKFSYSWTSLNGRLNAIFDRMLFFSNNECQKYIWPTWWTFSALNAHSGWMFLVANMLKLMQSGGDRKKKIRFIMINIAIFSNSITITRFSDILKPRTYQTVGKSIKKT